MRLLHAIASLLLAAGAARCAGPARPPPVAAPVAPEPSTHLEMIGPCTEEVCPRTKPCCHSCSAGLWVQSEAPHRAGRAAAGQLPDCQVDGCGRCPFHLEAAGRVEGDTFVVTRWTKVSGAGCVAQRCRGEGACDAIVGAGLWVWTGERCAPFRDSGCGLAGPDCARLYGSQEDCQRQRASCPSTR